MDASAWDRRYASADLVWGVEPNRFVASELAELPPGRALDLACGEGRNAIWLARRGWDVVGLDFSATAVERGRALAADAPLPGRLDLRVQDVVARPLPHGPFDLVLVCYLQLPADDRRRVLRSAVSVLAERGTLLVVAHDLRNLTEGVGGPQDPEVLCSPGDVLADVAGLEVVAQRAEVVERLVETDEGARPALDTLVRLRRNSRRP